MSISTQRPMGITLPELMAAVAIVGLLAAMSIVRFTGTYDTSKSVPCHAHQAEIELQAQLWYRANGSFPAADLSDIGANSSYFSGGLPQCPVNGTNYTIDTSTGRVIGHDH